MRWLYVALAACALGVAASASDALAGGLPPNEVARALSVILNSGSAWAGLAVLAGWYMPRPIEGAAAGVVALVVAVLVYYAFGLRFGDRTDVGFSALSPTAMEWLVLALLPGAALGLVGWLTHSPGAMGLLAALVVPVGVVVETVGLRGLGAETFRDDRWLASAQLVMVLAACVGAVLAVASWRRRRQRLTERVLVSA